MKKQTLYLLLLFLPFIGMIIVNEFVKLSIEEEGYHHQGIIAINSALKFKEQCSWVCHNNTAYCKENHVKFAQPYFDKIDPIYFGIINALKSTGNYGLANILFLVGLLPLGMYFLLVKSIAMQFEIRAIKKQ